MPNAIAVISDYAPDLAALMNMFPQHGCRTDDNVCLACAMGKKAPSSPGFDA